MSTKQYLVIIFLTSIFPATTLANEEDNPGEQWAIRTEIVCEDSYESEIETIVSRLGGQNSLRIKWHSNGVLKSLYGIRFLVNCSPDGYDHGIRDFFKSNSDVFNIKEGELRLAKIVASEDGNQIYSYIHEVEAVRVHNSIVKIWLDKEGNIVAVFTRYMPILNYNILNMFQGLESDQEEAFRMLEAEGLACDSGRPIIYQSDPTNEQQASLMFMCKSNAEESYRVIVEISQLSILSKTKVKSIEYAKKQINASAFFHDIYNQTCSSTNECSQTPYVHNYDCSFDFSPNQYCIDSCTTDQGCASQFGDDYTCGGASGDFVGYCHAVSYYDNYRWIYADYPFPTGWRDSIYQYHTVYSIANSALSNVIDFHYNGLHRNGWKAAQYPTANVYYVTNICAHGLECHPNCTWGQGCGPSQVNGAYPEEPFISPEDLSSLQYATDVMAHEWGHVSTWWDCSEYDIDDIVHWPDEVEALEIYSDAYCLTEGIATMHEILGIRYFDYYSQLGWRDYPSGLGPPVGGGSAMDAAITPWGPRSYFDRTKCLIDESTIWTNTQCTSGVSHLPPCGPYHACAECTESNGCPYTIGNWYCMRPQEDHANYRQLARFMRVLADGTATFANDGYGEDVGITFNGIGQDYVRRIVNMAQILIEPEIDINDWADLLIAAGSYYGYGQVTEQALGLTGIVLEVNNKEWLSDKAPYQYHFQDWTKDANKTVWIYKENGTNNIIMRYYYSGSARVTTISANTVDAPGVASYNGRLYVIWRDKDTSYIKLIYLRGAQGDVLGPYSLNTIGLRTDGAVDATDFETVSEDRSLVIAFSWDDGAFAARCTYDWCQNSTAHWVQYPSGSGNYGKLLISGAPGLGVVSASGINGNSDLNTEFMYLFSADPYGGGLYIDAYDRNLTHQYNFAMFPYYYPAYRGAEPLGITVMKSAFPNGNNYIYLAWKSYLDDVIYASVLQRFDTINHLNWITYPWKTPLVSTSGVRLKKGEGVNINTVTYTYSDLATDQIKEGFLYGRY